MKALILSGGKGTRLRPITHTRAKQLLPLANKPVLFYAIESILTTGIRDIGIVIGDTGDEIRTEVGDGIRWGVDVRITYIHQKIPLGLAHAIKIAQPFLGNDRFIMYLGDNFLEENLTPLVRAFSQVDCDYHCQILIKSVPNPQDFGVVELMSEMTNFDINQTQLCVKRLIEKPEIPMSNFVLVGVYLFDSHIFEAVEAIHPSLRGELEITDAIQWLIDHKYKVRPHHLQSYWIDTGKMEDILEANRLVLSKIVASIAETSYIDTESHLYGAVVVQKGAKICNSVIRGPAIIGEHAELVNAYIGPFTSIYHDVTIQNSEIEHSIVLEYCRIIEISGRIEDSLLGRNVEIYSSSIKPKAYKFMLGDQSKVGLL